MSRSDNPCRIFFINSRLSFKTADLAHCIASTSSEITDDEFKSTICITWLMRGMSARLCDVQLDAFAWQYCPGKYNYNGGRNKGSSSLMMTKSKHQAPIRYYKLTSRNNMYGEATCHISYLVECRHICSFSNSQWFLWGLCVGGARPNLRGPCVFITAKQYSMAWGIYSSARGGKAWWKLWYA